MVVDPATQLPLANGDLSKLLESGVFAWRVSGQALNTVLNLAAPLAYSYDRTSVTIYGNVADATQGQSTGEVLGNGDASKAFLSFALSQSPLTYLPAATASGAASTLTVAVNDRPGASSTTWPRRARRPEPTSPAKTTHRRPP